MPDGIINPVSVASAFVSSPAARPSELIAAVIAAVRPLIHPEELELKKGVGDADVAAALQPVAGQFTIVDAVFVVDALDKASYRSDLTSLPAVALGAAEYTLRQFIYSGLASSREDVAAREVYSGKPVIAERSRLLLSKTLRFDIQALLDGDYSSGHRFDGDQPNLSPDFNPTPWWRQRDGYLSQMGLEE